MYERDNILISVHQRHAMNMMSGDKTVELRRRPLRVAPGTRVWIYSKVPRGSVEAVGTVDHIAASSPGQIWKEFGDQTGISQREFFEYFSGSETAYAIVFQEVQRLDRPLSLQEIRKHSSKFQPPQFFVWLSSDNVVLNYFHTALEIPR